MKNPKAFIIREMKALAIPESCTAWKLVYIHAMAAAVVLTDEGELANYISDYADSLPMGLFRQE